jgi:predicted anti-sigma-YlaC factor YlaD
VCIKRGVGSIRNSFAASCGETADNLSGYLEDALAFPRRRRVARHLRRCIRCQSLLDSLAWTVEQLRALGTSEHRLPSLADEVIERIRGEAARRPS